MGQSILDALQLQFEEIGNIKKRLEKLEMNTEQETMNFCEAVEWMRESANNIARHFGNCELGICVYRIKNNKLQYESASHATSNRQWFDNKNPPLGLLGTWKKEKPKTKLVDFHTAMLYLGDSPFGTTIERETYHSLYRLIKGKGISLERKLLGEDGWEISPTSYHMLSSSRFLIPADHEENEN